MNKPAFVFDGRLLVDSKKLTEIGFKVRVNSFFIFFNFFTVIFLLTCFAFFLFLLSFSGYHHRQTLNSCLRLRVPIPSAAHILLFPIFFFFLFFSNIPTAWTSYYYMSQLFFYKNFFSLCWFILDAGNRNEWREEGPRTRYNNDMWDS